MPHAGAACHVTPFPAPRLRIPAFDCRQVFHHSIRTTGTNVSTTLARQDGYCATYFCNYRLQYFLNKIEFSFQKRNLSHKTGAKRQFSTCTSIIFTA
jgi:hypothetical protein